jgi:hypothetical protein
VTKREQIIVGIMLLVVVYGVYALFFSSPSKKALVSNDKELETLNAFIAKVADSTKAGLTEEQAYMLQKAQAGWKQDPFVSMTAKIQAKEEQETIEHSSLKGRIVYTGFLQMGNKRLAIINGMEYETGDRLEPGGFSIRSIHPDRVVLASPDMGKKTFILPLEEMD